MFCCLCSVSSFIDLQVILSPMEAIADTYRALLPEGSGADFQRILDLKVSDMPAFKTY